MSNKTDDLSDVFLTDKQKLVKIAEDVGILEAIIENIQCFIDGPTAEEAIRATKEAVAYMVTFYGENERWPHWWELFEGGRKVGYSEGQFDKKLHGH